MHVRICRECGEEYRPEIAVCSDCGGALEDRYERIESSPDGFDLRAALPVAEFSAGPLVPVATAGTASEIEPLGRRLGEAGIRFAVRGSIRSFELLVAADDHEPALALLEAGAGGDVASTEPIAACPACGTKLTQATIECPECGLGLGAEEASASLCCARCGQPRVGGLPCACSTGE
jgi:uncharacterized protein with PIN domain